MFQLQSLMRRSTSAPPSPRPWTTAFNMTLVPAFSPYANDIFFLHGVFLFEDVGVTAYTVRLCPMPRLSLHAMCVPSCEHIGQRCVLHRRLMLAASNSGLCDARREKQRHLMISL